MPDPKPSPGKLANENPYNPPMSPPAKSESRVRREDIKSFLLTASTCGLPLLNYLYTYLFWLIAGFLIGRPVVPYRDDPKDFFWGLPNILSATLMVLSLAIAPVVLAIGHQRKQLARHVALYCLALALSVILFRMNLSRVTDWITD